MEHTKAQKRMLICAAFFSFGTLGGSFTAMHLSPQAAERCGAIVSRIFVLQPMLSIPAAMLVLPLLLLLFGSSAPGRFLACIFLALPGYLSGFALILARRLEFHPLACLGFCLLFALCLVQLSSGMMRRASLVSRQIRCGDLFRPDYRFDTGRIGCALILILISGISFAYFILHA